MCLLATLCTHSNIRTRVNTFAFTYVHMYLRKHKHTIRADMYP